MWCYIKYFGHQWLFSKTNEKTIYLQTTVYRYNRIGCCSPPGASICFQHWGGHLSLPNSLPPFLSLPPLSSSTLLSKPPDTHDMTPIMLSIWWLWSGKTHPIIQKYHSTCLGVGEVIGVPSPNFGGDVFPLSLRDRCLCSLQYAEEKSEKWLLQWTWCTVSGVLVCYVCDNRKHYVVHCRWQICRQYDSRWFFCAWTDLKHGSGTLDSETTAVPCHSWRTPFSHTLCQLTVCQVIITS